MIEKKSALHFQIDPFVNKSVRNACLPPTAIEKPDCQGYLGNLCSQKGNKTNTWRRRYYILKDACIYIYSDYYAENAIGKLNNNNPSLPNNPVGLDLD